MGTSVIIVHNNLTEHKNIYIQTHSLGHIRYLADIRRRINLFIYLVVPYDIIVAMSDYFLMSVICPTSAAS